MQASDMDLVREFAASNSDAVFTALVERHINLVYSAALRRLRNPQEADDVAQVVFIILAKKAGSLRQGTILSGWLYQTTQLTAANFLRTKIRRQRREQEAFMEFDQQAQSKEWPQLSAFLEDAMSQLRQQERDAIVLRFFENRTISEVAAALGLGEAAAQKRVNRATDKLREFFTNRGIQISNNGLLTSIGNYAVQIAPAGLASFVATAGIAKGATASVSTSTLIKGALKVMAWAKAKTAITVGAIVILTAGTTAIVVKTFLGPTNAKRASVELTPAETNSPGFKLTEEAAAYVHQLRIDGKLPGAQKDKSIVLIWQTAYSNAIPYPVVVDFLGRATNPATPFTDHYTVIKSSPTNAWQLQKAWRTDKTGKVLEEYSVQ